MMVHPAIELVFSFTGEIRERICRYAMDLITRSEKFVEESIHRDGRRDAGRVGYSISLKEKHKVRF